MVAVMIAVMVAVMIADMVAVMIAVMVAVMIADMVAVVVAVMVAVRRSVTVDAAGFVRFTEPSTLGLATTRHTAVGSPTETATAAACPRRRC